MKFPFYIDLDNDGVTDISSEPRSWMSGMSYHQDFSVSPKNGYEISYEPVITYLSTLRICKMYENGTEVNDTTFAGTDYYYMFYTDSQYNNNHYDNILVDGWLNQGPKYIAYRKKVGNIYKYGWIKIELTSMYGYGVLYKYSTPKEYTKFVIDDN